MKQYTAVTERHASYYLTGVLVALAVGTVRFDAADEVCFAEQDAGVLWGGECAADGGDGDAAGDAGRVGRGVRADSSCRSCSRRSLRWG